MPCSEPRLIWTQVLTGPSHAETNSKKWDNEEAINPVLCTGYDAVEPFVSSL
jgi:hypothetical protein